MKVHARARASKFVSSSERNDNESTDTSKGPGKRGSTKKERENAKLKYSAPSEEKIKQARFSSASQEKKNGGREKDRNRQNRR